jgi:hypothetical protein
VAGRSFLVAIAASALLVAGCGSARPRVRQEIVVHIHHHPLSRKQLANFCRHARSMNLPLRPFCHVHRR